MAYNSQSMALTGALPAGQGFGGSNGYQMPGQDYGGPGGTPNSPYDAWQSGQPQNVHNTFDTMLRGPGQQSVPAPYMQGIPVTPGTQNFTSSYGGGSSPSMRDTNVEDYWNGSGYDEIGASQEYQPYDYTNTYQVGNLPTDQWANANTYAPWSGGPTQDLDYGEINPWAGGKAPFGTDTDPQWGGAVGGGAAGMGTGAALYGGAGLASGGIGGMAGIMSAGVLGPAGLIGAGLGYGMSSLFGKKKKRGSTGWQDTPSYQGQMFTPEEGFPSYYSPSQETQNQTQQGLYDQANQFAYQQPQQQGYDYNYSGGMTQPQSMDQQNYVGQQEQEYGSFYNKDKGGIYDTFTV